MDYIFDDNVPLPEKPATQGKRSVKHPLWFLPVGKSHFIAGAKLKSTTAYGRVIGQRLEKRGETAPTFEYRAVTEGGVEGVRVWRSA